MNNKTSDLALGAIVITLAIATVAYFLMRGDDCMDKARAFVSNAPAVTAKAGKVISVGTSSWLSGQASAASGQRPFYFLIKGEKSTANAVVHADRATCTCRLVSLN